MTFNNLCSKQIIIAAQERKAKNQELFLPLFGSCVHIRYLIKTNDKEDVIFFISQLDTYQMSLPKMEGIHKSFQKQFLERIIRTDLFYFFQL